MTRVKVRENLVFNDIKFHQIMTNEIVHLNTAFKCFLRSFLVAE